GGRRLGHSPGSRPLTAAFGGLAARADWPLAGRELTAAVGDQQLPQIATDGASGAIVVWQDSRTAPSTIFARRVLVSGELDPVWPVDGLRVLSDPTALAAEFAGQQLPVVVSDGHGGVIVAWQDGRSQVNGL